MMIEESRSNVPTSPPLLRLSERKTNWWALGGLALAALVVGLAIRANRPAASGKPTRQDWIELHGQASYFRDRASFGEALQAGLAAAELAPKVYGPNHMAVAESLNTLGLIYADMARYDESLAAYEAAVPILQQTFGPMSKEVAQAGSNLALTLMRMGNMTRPGRFSRRRSRSPRTFRARRASRRR